MTTPEYPGSYAYPDNPYPAGRHARPEAGYYPPLGAGADLPPAAPMPPRPSSNTASKVVAVLVGAGAIALVAGTMGGALGYVVARETLPAQAVAAAAGTTASGAVSAMPGSIADIAARVQPAVVQLNVQGSAGEGTGSGFVISKDGFLITNNHVAAVAGDGGEIEVVFSDGTKVPGKLIGTNPGYDIAVVKVDRKKLPTVDIGSSDALQVGDSVIAVGSPLGLTGTVTTGIVSALNRPVTAGGEGETAFISAIQTDAAINPGNSGGPLLNGKGEVIGINSAIASMGATQGEQAGSIGLGFAIPIDVAGRIADEIIKTGSSTTPVLGIQLNMQYQGDGAQVAEVTPGGGAEAAGLQPGDKITAVNGKPLEDATQLIVTVRAQQPGDTLSLTVERGGQQLTVPITLQASTG